MAADEPAHLGMLVQHGGQFFAVPQPHAVDPLKAERPWVMMYEDDRRLIAMLQEIMSEPLDLPTDSWELLSRVVD